MFITFEGIEGSGKSTQCHLLYHYLSQQGYEVLCSREPGGSQLGLQLRKILLHQDSQSLTKQAELMLYLADRAQHVADVIMPALEKGQIVLVDRYIDSTTVYQGFGRKINPDIIQELNQFVAKRAWPEITFLLDLTAEAGLKRARSRNESQKTELKEGRFEAENLEFHRHIRHGYLKLATQDPERIIILDGSASINSIFEAIKQIMQKQLA